VQRRRRRSAIGVAALAAILLAACSPAESPAPTGGAVAASARPTPAAGPTHVPDPTSPNVRGITPTSSAIVASAQAVSDVGGPSGPGVLIYADGSIVDARGGPISVRALAPGGLEWITSHLRESGLFTASRDIPFKPVDHGFMTYQVTFVDTGRAAVTVTATNVGDDAESRLLVELAERIFDPVTWLPRDGWVEGDSRAHPYVARETRLTSEVGPLRSDAWINAAQMLDRVTWPLDASPFEIGLPIEIEGAPNRALRCAIITGAQEAVVRSSLALMVSEREHPFVAAWYLWTAGPGLLGLSLRPFLPHETAGCAPEDMPPAPSLDSAPRPSLAALLLTSQGGGWTPTGAAQGPRLIVVAHDNARQESGERRVSYYPDGTVLFFEPAPPTVGIGARRLSAAGLEALNAEIARSGLVDVSYSEPIPDDVEVEVMYNVLTDGVILNASDRGVDGRAIEIARLAERLLDPVAWLPATSWIGDPTTMLQYRPDSVDIRILRQPNSGSEILPPVELLAWPGGGSVETFGQLEPDNPDVRHATLTPGQAVDLVRALAAIGAGSYGSTTRVTYWLAASDPGTNLEIELAIPSGDWGL
jgi:hypothetical protein